MSEERDWRYICGIIAGASLFMGLVGAGFVLPMRYQIIDAGTGRGLIYKIDKWSGRVTAIESLKEWPVEIKKEALSLTLDQQRKQDLSPTSDEVITGYAVLKGDVFSGGLYNGSKTKTIRRVVFSVVAKKYDGSVIWTREYAHNLSINPLSSEYFSIHVVGGAEAEKHSWSIKDIYGGQEQ